jgi:hypothetical protein
MIVWGVRDRFKGREVVVKRTGRVPFLFQTRREALRTIENGDATRPAGHVLRPVKFELREVKPK